MAFDARDNNNSDSTAHSLVSRIKLLLLLSRPAFLTTTVVNIAVSDGFSEFAMSSTVRLSAVSL